MCLGRCVTLYWARSLRNTSLLSLEQSGKEDERLFQDRSSARKYGVFYALLAVALFVFLTVYLIGIDLALYQDVLKIIVAFAGGVGSGFGIKAFLDRR